LSIEKVIEKVFGEKRGFASAGSGDAAVGIGIGIFTFDILSFSLSVTVSPNSFLIARHVKWRSPVPSQLRFIFAGLVPTGGLDHRFPARLRHGVKPHLR